jgi:hypothetical protein
VLNQRLYALGECLQLARDQRYGVIIAAGSITAAIPLQPLISRRPRA